MDSSYSSILMLVLLIVVFYFILIRPENKRKKAAEQMRSDLKKGDKLTTIGGIVGTVVQVNEDTLVLETSEDRVRLEVTKWAVSTTGVQTSSDGRDNNKKKKEISNEIPEEPAELESSEDESDTEIEETKD